MNIKILHLVEGAKKATGVTVVIDVFRAFTVEAYLMSQGAEKIFPVGDIDFAYKYKEEHPETLLVGERHGKMCEGFDYGNSPMQFVGKDLSGKTVIHTTSAGTQGIANATNAEVLLTGSLTNAKAVAEYIKSLGATDVSLVCMGLEALAPTEEDTLCARYIESILLGEPLDLTEEIENLKITSGAKFFDEAQKEVFPTEDFYLSTKVDIFPFVLRVYKDENGMDYVKKIDIKI
ncbi:MAG: 2-phosphosulfolactate phosphatase [Clostridia bacterium]|nr:2-phosphosulfolactate phosphatase [Clostridia bacterium]